MRDVLDLANGQGWKEIQSLDDALRVAELSRMSGVRTWFEIDRERSWDAPYYALFSSDGTQVDVVVRGRGPRTLNSTPDGIMVFGNRLTNPFIEHSAAIDALGAEIDLPLDVYRGFWDMDDAVDESAAPAP